MNLKAIHDFHEKQMKTMLGFMEDKKCQVEECTNKAEHFAQYTGDPESRMNLCEEHYIQNNEEFHDKWADTEETRATGN